LNTLESFESMQHHHESSSHAEEKAASEERFVEGALESTGAAEGLMAATKNGLRVLKVLKKSAFVALLCIAMHCHAFPPLSTSLLVT